MTTADCWRVLSLRDSGRIELIVESYPLVVSVPYCLHKPQICIAVPGPLVDHLKEHTRVIFEVDAVDPHHGDKRCVRVVGVPVTPSEQDNVALHCSMKARNVRRAAGPGSRLIHLVPAEVAGLWLT